MSLITPLPIGGWVNEIYTYIIKRGIAEISELSPFFYHQILCSILSLRVRVYYGR